MKIKYEGRQMDLRREIHPTVVTASDANPVLDLPYKFAPLACSYWSCGSFDRSAWAQKL